MKAVLFAALLVLTFDPGAAQPRGSSSFDPVGRWTYSTHDDAGAPVSGTMEITGKPGAYTGTLVSGPDRKLEINDVLTSPSGMVVLANLPDGGVAVIKVWKGADGKIQAGWGAIRQVIPATVDRAK